PSVDRSGRRVSAGLCPHGPTGRAPARSARVALRSVVFSSASQPPVPPEGGSCVRTRERAVEPPTSRCVRKALAPARAANGPSRKARRWPAVAVARVEAAAPVGRGSNVDFVSQGDEPTLLTRHLRQWLGKWPAESELDIEESSGRIRPGWDGAIHPVIGVASPSGAVLSVPPRHAKHLRRRYAELGGLDALAVEIPAAVGFPRSSWYRAVFRWTTSPSPLPEVGEW